MGDAGARGVLAVLMILARSGSEVAVLWLPVWGPGRLAKQPAAEG